MKVEHRLAVILALLPVLALGAWRMTPGEPNTVDPCGNPIGVKVEERILAVCLGDASEMSLTEVLARVGVEHDCPDRGDVVVSGQLVIPSQKEPCGVAIEPLPGQVALILGVRIDINRADATELQALPRIGPKKAKWIVDDRRRRGRYERLEDLQRVKGIGPKTVEHLRPLVRVD